MLTALNWILYKCKLGCYTYKGLMEVDIAKVYNISTKEVRKLAMDARKTFVEKWKGPMCNDFTRQREHISLIPQSIISFM